MSTFSEENPPSVEQVLARVDVLLRGMSDKVTLLMRDPRVTAEQRQRLAETLINFERQLSRKLMPSPEIIQAATQSLMVGESPFTIPN